MLGTHTESRLACASGGILPAPITVLAFPNPFRPATRHTFQFDGERTVEELVELCGFDLSKPWDLVASIAGYRVPRHAWRWTRPNPGTVVTIRAIPHGARGKAIGQILVGLALIAVAWWTGGVTLPYGIGFVSGAAIALAGAAFVLSGSVSLASPPPSVPFTGEIPTSESRAIAAAQNEARPFAPVPRVFGLYRVFPQYAAKPFTEIVGNDQFLRLLFTFGYGPLQITELKIGEDLIDTFNDVEYAILPGFDDDPPLSIFTNGVDELDVQAELVEGVAAFTVRTTEPNTYEASVDLVFPAGLIAFNNQDGEPRKVVTDFRIETRIAGSADAWVGVTISAPFGPGISNPAPGDVVLSARSRGSLSRGVRWLFPSVNQWEVRIRRDGNDYPDGGGNGEVLSDCTWAKLRSIRPGTAPRVPNLAMVELRIRATDQLAGQIQTLSAMVESILPVWNGIDEWGPANRLSTNPSLFPTRNPAWALAEMLRGGVNYRPVPDENIDALSIAEWSISNAAANRWLDAVIDFDTTIGEVCRDICGSARASFNLIDGRYGVVIDEPKPTIVAQFSARDTSKFESRKVFQRQTHGLRVRFISPAAGYEPDERIVYADGYNETNALELVDLDLWGVTDADRAYQDGRYHMAAGRLRPEVYSFEIDVAHLAITRGDRVLYSHDVMLVGLGSGRVRQVYTSGSDVYAIKLDEIIEYDPAIAYAVRIRNSSTGVSILCPIRNLGFDTDEVWLWPVVPTSAGIAVGDLVAWGESGSETGEYLVQSIYPTAELSARVELVDYSPAIFTADTEEIPPFDPNITDPRPRITITPSRPSIVSVASDESVLLIDQDGTHRARILISVQTIQGDTVPAAFIQAQYRTADPVGEWYSSPQVDARTSQVSIEGIDQGEAYDLRVRAVSGEPIPGRASDWATVFGHVVVGASTPPADVTDVRVDPGELLVWEYPTPPRDFAGFRVRHQAGTDTTWQTAIPAHDGLVTVSTFSIAPLPPGERTILVKAVDTAGNESLIAGVVVVSIGGLAIENIVEEEDFHAAGFLGTKTNCTVEGGSGDLIADYLVDVFWAGPPGGLFWGAGAQLFWGDSFEALEYVDEWTPPSAALPGRLFLDLNITGSNWAVYYREQGATTWLRWPGFIDAVDGITYEFRITIDGGQIRGRVLAFAAQIDRPDIEERFDDFVVASTGTVRLAPSLAFVVVKQVLLTVQADGNAGVSARVLDKNATLGPSIEVLNAAGTRVTGLIDARVRGY
jgi:hypothetical protein